MGWGLPLKIVCLINKNMKICKKYQGFTLIEVLACSMIMAVSAVGIVNLLRMSDAAHMRGKLDSRTALVFRDVVDRINSYPFEDFRTLVANAGRVGGNGAIFSYGESGGDFPFYPAEDATTTKYLMMGKPLPGETAATGMYPYVVVVEALDNTSYFQVRVTITWQGYRDQLVGGVYVPSERSVFLEFQKWDASQS